VCDELVLLNHASTDRTPEIIAEIALEHFPRVHVHSELDRVWVEMSHRQKMLDIARQAGATHIAYIDADEMLTGDKLQTIRGWIETTPAGHMLSLPWLQIKEGLAPGVMSTGMWASQPVDIAFRDEPRAHWAARAGYDFHQRQPLGRTWGELQPDRATPPNFRTDALSVREPPAPGRETGAVQNV